MGVTTFTQEFTVAVPAAKMFKALQLDAHNIFPKMMPDFIKSVEFIEGDGGVGSIRLTHFAEGVPYKLLKHRVDAVDVDNNYCKYTLLEGGNIGEIVEFITQEYKYEDSGEGCVLKLIVCYYTKGDEIVSDETVEVSKQSFSALIKAGEEYLLANP